MHDLNNLPARISSEAAWLIHNASTAKSSILFHLKKGWISLLLPCKTRRADFFITIRTLQTTNLIWKDDVNEQSHFLSYPSWCCLTGK